VNGVYTATGQGIQTILESQGYTVTNISVAGDANNNIAQRIKGNTADHILFLQTDPFREHCQHKDGFKKLRPVFFKHLLTFDSIDHCLDVYYNNLYTTLNRLNKPIICLGGWSKLHPSIYNYSNLIPAVPSITELLIPTATDVYLSDFEWFAQLNDNVEVMLKFGTEIKQIMLESSTKFDLINQQWNDVHPNLQGYMLLVEKIRKYLL
jgi:hypothetical protein